MAQNNTPNILSGRQRLILQNPSQIDGASMHIGAERVLCFTSAGFLGFHQHPAVAQAVRQAMEQWPVSLGFTRILGTDPFTLELEKALAKLTCQEAALVYPSTHHLAMDVLPLLAGPRGVLLVDEFAYATSRAGVRRAEQAGLRSLNFKHNSIRSLERHIETVRDLHPKIIVVDGVYSPSGEKARISEMVQIADNHDATIFMDDANGIGILGANPDAAMPYGYEGRGTGFHTGISSTARILHAGSLAKAFGIPVAFIAGPTDLLRPLRVTSSTAVHSSPPSLPNLAAALAAVELHVTEGDNLRRKLLTRVRLFRDEMQGRGIHLAFSHDYPIQSLALPDGRRSLDLAANLRKSGIWAVLQMQPQDLPHDCVLRFLITVLHSKAAIGRTVETVSALIDDSRHDP